MRGAAWRLGRPRRRMPWSAATAAVMVAGLLWAPQAQALKFRVIRGGEALLVYDCGRLGFEGETAASCAPHERQFSGPTRYENSSSYAGDAQVLERMLRGGSYRQVLLASGGGNLDQGVKVGELLRQFNAYVVVPKGASCVSACTVAFLGGLIREVEPGGSYQVHAYSSLMDASKEFLGDFASAEGEFALDDFVKRSARSGAVWAQRLLLYAQQMIGGRPRPAAIDALNESLPNFRAEYMASGAFKRDLERMRQEGPAVAQEVLMRIERTGFETALNHYKRHQASLGLRAEHAIRILELMFSSRITGTATLDADTLKEMGYTNVRK